VVGGVTSSTCTAPTSEAQVCRCGLRARVRSGVGGGGAEAGGMLVCGAVGGAVLLSYVHSLRFLTKPRKPLRKPLENQLENHRKPMIFSFKNIKI